MESELENYERKAAELEQEFHDKPVFNGIIIVADRINLLVKLLIKFKSMLHAPRGGPRHEGIFDIYGPRNGMMDGMMDNSDKLSEYRLLKIYLTSKALEQEIIALPSPVSLENDLFLKSERKLKDKILLMGFVPEISTYDPENYEFGEHLGEYNHIKSLAKTYINRAKSHSSHHHDPAAGRFGLQVEDYQAFIDVILYIVIRYRILSSGDVVADGDNRDFRRFYEHLDNIGAELEAMAPNTIGRSTMDVFNGFVGLWGGSKNVQQQLRIKKIHSFW
jgi:hypothetical protein